MLPHLSVSSEEPRLLFQADLQAYNVAVNIHLRTIFLHPEARLLSPVSSTQVIVRD